MTTFDLDFTHPETTMNRLRGMYSDVSNPVVYDLSQLYMTRTRTQTGYTVGQVINGADWVVPDGYAVFTFTESLYYSYSFDDFQQNEKKFHHLADLMRVAGQRICTIAQVSDAQSRFMRQMQSYNYYRSDLVALHDLTTNTYTIMKSRG